MDSRGVHRRHLDRIVGNERRKRAGGKELGGVSAKEDFDVGKLSNN